MKNVKQVQSVYQKIMLLCMIIIIAAGCSAVNNTVSDRIPQEFRETEEPYIKYFTDYDNFTDTLLTQADYRKIQSQNIRNYIKAYYNRSGVQTRRLWFYHGKLKMAEYFSEKGMLLSQILKTENNIMVKRMFHYVGDKLFKINIYLNEKVNAIIEYFYNVSNRILKVRKYHSDYSVASETYFRYHANGKVEQEQEYAISSEQKRKSLIREYNARYRNNVLTYDEEFLVDHKGKYKIRERHFNYQGQLNTAVVYSTQERGKKLFLNRYKNNVLIQSESYFPDGKVRSRINYRNSMARFRVEYSDRGSMVLQKHFDEMGRISSRSAIP